MSFSPKTQLSHKKRYLQLALNSSLEEAKKVINDMPISDRIILEVGTPIIKKYGEYGIRQIRNWYQLHLLGQSLYAEKVEKTNPFGVLGLLVSEMKKAQNNTQGVPSATKPINFFPYIIADMKTMDRGETEVEIATQAGANAVIALGSAPIETLNNFIDKCESLGVDAMIDMMNVEFPLTILRALKKLPPIVILHRGVDEERDNKQKMLPLHEIRRIKGAHDILIAVAGGDTIREVKSSIFNDADIVIVWKSVYQETDQTQQLIESFLKEIK